MQTNSWALLFLLGATMAAGAGGRSVTIAEMKTWQIVCDSGATESERYAAGEFQTLFKGLTGKTLPIVQESAGSGAIFIGPDAVARFTKTTPSDSLGEEGLCISVQNNAVCITGGRPRGVLYGVYEFFEELCGVRYLTHDDTFFPPNAESIKLPRGTRSYTPQFAFRWSYYGETSKYPEFAARLHTNTVSTDAKLGGRTGYQLVSHNVAYLVPPSQYGTEHPEYYALVDGQRRLDMKGGGPQLCMSNPEVLERVVSAVLEEIKKNPTAKNINIAQMDNESFCTCDACAAIDAREESHAGATLTLVNAVAERIEKTHPDVLISTYAYQYTRKPPKTARARHNVMIQLCSIECCDFHAIDDAHCSINRIFCDDMAGWKKKADTIFIWHYNTNFKGYELPFPNLRSIGESVSYFNKNNGRGVFMQAAGNGFSTELSDLRNYVMSRCLWKPGRNSWKEAEEFCRLHYRESAQPIIEYLTYYHDLVDASGAHPTCFPTESALCVNPESAQRMLAYFDEALSLARSDAVRERVEKASICAYRAALSAAGMRLIYDNGLCRPALSGLDTGILDRYTVLAARYGVTMEDELTPVEEYLQGVTKLYAGIKAVRLENETWRLVVLPEWNGRIIEMLYKPTGKNVVQASRSFNRFRHEEWVGEGQQGPTGQRTMEYAVDAQPTSAALTLATEDGSELRRKIELDGDVVRFETMLRAGAARIFDFHVHPEYDAGTASDDPREVRVYVKNPDWSHANKRWRQAVPTDAQTDLIRKAVAGGAFAFYNRALKFGVEQRFDPEDFRAISLFWSPSRIQVNLEMLSQLVSLEKGDEAHYVYEVRYLNDPPR